MISLRPWRVLSAAVSPSCVRARPSPPGGFALSLALIALAWCGAGSGVALADAGDFYRVYTPEDADTAKVLSLGYPTVLSKPRSFVDVIVGAGGLARLQSLGLSATLLQRDLEGSFDRARTHTGPGGYHRYAQMLELLRRLAAGHPDLFKLTSLGPSWETQQGLASREIWAMEVTRGVRSPAARMRPGVLFTGGIHAREVSTTEVLLGFLERIAASADEDPAIDDVLATRRMVVVPMTNPDGREYVFTTDKWWRKNRHVFGTRVQVGVDLNRNFGFHWGDPSAPGGSTIDPASSTYRGPMAFSEPETRALRRLVDREPFSASLAYHSYGQYIITPFGFTQAPPRDAETYRVLAQRLAGDRSYSVGDVHETVGYASTGRHDDWLYGEDREKPSILALEVELGLSFFPPVSSLPSLTDDATRLNLILARAAGAQVSAQATWVRPELDAAQAGSAADHARAVLVTVKNEGLRAAQDLSVRLIAPEGVDVQPHNRSRSRLEGLLDAGGHEGSQTLRFSIAGPPGASDAGMPALELSVELRYTDGAPVTRSIRLGLPAD